MFTYVAADANVGHLCLNEPAAQLPGVFSGLQARSVCSPPGDFIHLCLTVKVKLSLGTLI